MMLIEKGQIWQLSENTAHVLQLSLSNVLEIKIAGVGAVISVMITEFDFFHGEYQDRLTIENPASLCPILRLIGMRVAQLEAKKSGQLDISFIDGSQITVHPSSDFEAWELFTSTGLKIVSMPGGTLAVWR